MATPNLNEFFWLQHGKEKYCLEGERNLRGSHFCEMNILRNIYTNRKESFTYGLPDFPRKDNTLLGSKLASYFKQITELYYISTSIIVRIVVP